MKRMVFLLIAAVTAGEAVELSEVIVRSDANPSLRAAEHKAKAYAGLYEASRADNYPSLDLQYSGTYLKEDPVVYMQRSFPGLPPGTQMQVQSRTRYTGALRLSYPLFTGFAVSARIDSARVRMRKALLEAEDARLQHIGIAQNRAERGAHIVADVRQNAPFQTIGGQGAVAGNAQFVFHLLA